MPLQRDVFTGKEIRVPLAVDVNQLIIGHPSEHWLLGLKLTAARKALLQIESQGQYLIHLGSSPTLIEGAFHQPAGSAVAVFERPETFSRDGWELYLFDPDRRPDIAPLCLGRGDAMFPVWSPDSRKIAFLLDGATRCGEFE